MPGEPMSIRWSEQARAELAKPVESPLMERVLAYIKAHPGETIRFTCEISDNDGVTWNESSP